MEYKNLTELRNLGFTIVRDFLGKSNLSELTHIKADACILFQRQFRRLNIDTGSFEKNFQTLAITSPGCLDETVKAANFLNSLHKLPSYRIVLDICQMLEVNFPLISQRPRLNMDYTGGYQSQISGPFKELRFWIPLVDCLDPLIGSVQMVPGSHAEFGLWPKTKESEYMDVPVSLGDALVFDSRSSFRRAPNKAPESIRWSCDLWFANANDDEWINRGYSI